MEHIKFLLRVFNPLNRIMNKQYYIAFIKNRIGLYNLVGWGIDDRLESEELPDGNVRISASPLGYAFTIISLDGTTERCRLRIAGPGGKDLLDLDACPTADIQKHLVEMIDGGGEVFAELDAPSGAVEKKTPFMTWIRQRIKAEMQSWTTSSYILNKEEALEWMSFVRKLNGEV